MRGIVLLLVALGTSWAMAGQADYEVQLRFFAEGKLIAEPTITTVVGEETELTQVSSLLNRKIRIKLVANDKKHPNIGNAIHLKMVMEYEQGDKKKEKTYKHYKDEPELMLQHGKEATISLTQGRSGPELLGMKVVAKRL